MTSYLTSMDEHLSISYRRSRSFDFKVFRVWPDLWPLKMMVENNWAYNGDSCQPPHPHLFLPSASTTCGEEESHNGRLSLPCESFGAQSSRLLIIEQCPRRSSPVFAQQATVHSPCIGPTRAEVTRIGQCLRLDAGRAPLASSATQNPMFKLCCTVFKCLQGAAPPYLSEFCQPLSSLAGRYQLRSAAAGDLLIPPSKTVTIGRRGFSISFGPVAWNGLPTHLKDPTLTFPPFQETIENTLFHDDVNSGNAPLWRLFERRLSPIRRRLRYCAFKIGSAV